MSPIYRAVLVVSLALALGANPTGAQEFAKLSDREIVEKYRDAIRNQLPSDMFVRSSLTSPVNTIRAELVRRGRNVVPDLLALLRSEAIDAGTQDRFVSFSPVAEITSALAAIGDPNSAPELLRLLTAESVSSQTRNAALSCLEQLTYCALRPVEPHVINYTTTVEHPTALRDKTTTDFVEIARLYRAWLAGEGKNSARWLPLARDRARKQVDGDKPDAIYTGIEFLRSHGGKREVLVAATAKVVGELKPGAKPDDWTYQGQRSSVNRATWVRLLTRFGSAARSHSTLLIRIQKDQGANAWWCFAWMREVAGTEIIDHFIDVLPGISKEVAAIKADPETPKSFDSSDPRLQWYSSLREVQLAIDRWAGRRFDSDEDRVKWWKANRQRKREDWLADNLDIAVKQADASEPWAIWVARELFPDIANDRPKPNFTKWLAENRARLKYDVESESFRLAPASK